MQNKMTTWGKIQPGPSANTITVRRLSLPTSPNLDPVLIEGLPEESFIYIAVSLLFPQLEPYLIRTMQKAKLEISEPSLLADVDAFIGQESQHFRQHILFNKSLNLEKYTGLKALVDEVEADYQRFTKIRSLAFNLAYAEGFEAGTTAVTRFAFDLCALERLHPIARDFFQWHLIEELEHKNVAFDVYSHVSGSFAKRVAVGLYAQWHLSKFVIRVIQHMIHADEQHYKSIYGGFWQSFKRLRSLIWPAVSQLLPNLIGTHMPWYTPHKILMTEHAKAFAALYSARTRSGAKSSEVTV